ncbi:aminodeoxychorismate synthase component I [Edaphobacter modestus]|uniref:Para-aminobenzoate synthetase/4-amino-4-deoxychorismate lyase n=1 Tax=Edaphobacter modestus TaxID=388466 RepID=A0A4Q7YXD0_9BACT|nr:aminodeoxychorismate synthase component I [Edaphobacter modestus]RZU42094.1 para-aminobenzoate synthetase/4-amino-4-deoxychorismate lyase [Edaphobacter modestus]
MSAWTQLPEYLRTLAAGSPDAVLLETSRFDEQNHHSYLFLNPIEAVSANTTDELHALFGWIETARQRGLHLAGYLAYECGYFLEHKLRRDSTPAPATGDSLPLAWFGAYAQPFVFDHSVGDFLGPAPPAVPSVAPPEIFVSEAALDIPQDEYTRKILAIKRYIEAGDTYQVNFTDSVTVSTHHDAAACLAVLSKTQPVAYGALLNVAGHHIVSLSPELFFRIRDGSIVTRPMKGTMPRGLDLAEDEQQMMRLEADEKNRSEHVMIVDLLRNDLGRICRMGSVHAHPLFAVERYRTLLQMTSTVSGELRPNLTFAHIFHALFPSGSITGAPKIRTMQIIHELERQPRGVYTGAIGHIAPSGDAEFNVAIRTLVLRDGIARMGVGGGIVADSDAASEYRECQLKASFLTRTAPQFQLIETMLFDGHGMPYLPLHLDRLASSAAYFDFPFDRSAIESRIEELAASLALQQRFRIRLLLAANGEVTVSPTAITEDSAPITIRISPCRVNSGDLLLRHKTTQRELYDREYARASQDGFDEVLFLNEKEELTEGAISTLFVNLEGSLLTPPLASGVLPGVLRRHVLATELNAAERPLTLDDLRSAEAAFLGNSVRGLRPIARIEMADPELPPILFPRILFPVRPA